MKETAARSELQKVVQTVCSLPSRAFWSLTADTAAITWTLKVSLFFIVLNA
jgi:hypothetical protein